MLLAGALSNLAMNGFASRLMLKSLCRMKSCRTVPVRRWEKMMNFSANRKRFLAVSAVFCLLPWPPSPCLGVRRDLPYQDGFVLTYTYQGELDSRPFQEAVEDGGGQTGDRPGENRLGGGAIQL